MSDTNVMETTVTMDEINEAVVDEKNEAVAKVEISNAAKVQVDKDVLAALAGAQNDDLAYQIDQDITEKMEGVYNPSEKENDAPDFDAEMLIKQIDEVLYIELPVLKKKVLAFKQNMQDIKFYMHMLPTYQKIMEKRKANPDYTPDSAEELAFYNELQRSGISMDMQLKSLDEKFDVNMKFIDQALARIDERYTNEAADMNKLTTSEKNAMLIKLAKKNLMVSVESESENRKLKHYLKSLIEVYYNRNTFNWLINKMNTGTTPRSIIHLYRTYMKTGEIKNRIKDVFGYEFDPKLEGVSDEKMHFFLFYVCHIAALNSSAKTIDINARIVKEYATCLLQNLADIAQNLYDITYCPGSVSGEEVFGDPEKDKFVTTYNAIEKLEDAEAFEKAKEAVADDYLEKLTIYINKVYDEAFLKK